MPPKKSAQPAKVPKAPRHPRDPRTPRKPKINISDNEKRQGQDSGPKPVEQANNGERSPDEVKLHQEINLDAHTLRIMETEDLVGFSDSSTILNSDPEAAAANKRSRAPSMLTKAVKARQRALVDKFADVESRLTIGLEKEDGIRVDCSALALGKNALMDRKFEYTHLMRLHSNTPFNLVKQVMLNEGPHAGHIAVLYKQSMPLPFMKLPTAVRFQIYSHLYVHDEDMIEITTRQGGSKEPLASGYRQRNKLAILRTCSELRDEVAPVVYGQTFRFSGTGVAASFLNKIRHYIKHLQYLRVDSYTSHTGRMMFGSLEEAKSLKRVSFAHVSSNQSPITAIENMYWDTRNFCMSVDFRNPKMGILKLHFDDAAYYYRVIDEKSGEERVLMWGPGEKLKFLDGLEARIDALV